MRIQTARCDATSLSTRDRAWLVAVFSALLTLASPLAVAEESESMVAGFASGLVFDAARSTIYAMEPDRLTARAADTGDLIWSRRALAEPLALDNGRLLVLGHREQPRRAMAFWLDPDSGRTLEAFELDLPENVSFLLRDRPAERFRALAFARAGDLFIAWDYTKRQLIGAPAVAGVNRAAKLPRVAGAGAQAEQSDTRLADTTLISASGAFAIDAGRAAAVDRQATGIEEFNRWATLHGADRSRAADGRQYRSRDGGPILASRLISDGDDWLRHQWTILDERDEPLARLRLPFAFAPFAVGETVLAYRSQPYARFADGEVVEARDRSLVVMNLEGGRVAWQLPLFDKTWREGMPP